MTRDSAIRILGLSPEYTQADLKSAYRSKVKMYHPDICTDDNAHDNFLLITGAYNYLNTNKPVVKRVLTHVSIFNVSFK